MYLITCNHVTIECHSESALRTWLDYILDSGWVPVIRKITDPDEWKDAA